MQLETNPISGKSSAPSANMNVPVVNTIPQKEKAPEKEKRAAELLDIKAMTADLQKNLKAFHNVDLHFSVHQASGQVMVVVTDEDTGEIIREIPSQEMLNLAAKLEEMMGLIFDQKA